MRSARFSLGGHQPERDAGSRLSLMVGMCLVLVPLDQRLPTAGGFSTLSIVIALIGYLAAVSAPAVVLRSLAHRVTLAGFSIVVVAMISESSRVYPSYDLVTRLMLFVFGIAVTAAVVRTARDLRVIQAAVVIMGSWLSFYIVATKFGALSSTQVTGFTQASALRAEVYESGVLDNNLNALAFLAALGAVTTLAWALELRGGRGALPLALLSAMQLLACMLTLSRDGILAGLLGCCFVILRAQGPKLRRITVAVFAGLVVFAIAPSAVLERFQGGNAENDARSVIARAAVRNLDEYFWLGVGEYAFNRTWGPSHGFARDGVVLGAHNSFLQVTIFWGILGLGALLLLAWLLLRAGAEFARVAETAQSTLVSAWIWLVLLRLLFTHTLSDKSFAILIGVAVGMSSAALRRREDTLIRPLEPAEQ